MGRVKGEFEEWLPGLGWDMRVDLTYRTGTSECDVADVSEQSARRSLRACTRRLAAAVGDRVTAFAAMERQSRGTVHWHVLWRFWSGCPFLPHASVKAVWQRWREWPKEDRRKGVEGHCWVTYLRGRRESLVEAVRYVVKYVVKGGPDSLVILDGVPGAQGVLSFGRREAAGVGFVGTGFATAGVGPREVRAVCT